MEVSPQSMALIGKSLVEQDEYTHGLEVENARLRAIIEKALGHTSSRSLMLILQEVDKVQCCTSKT